MFNQDFKELVQLLNVNEVEYLVVGGYALGAYKYARNTGYLDVWINPTPTNIKKLIKTLTDFGFRSLNLTKEDFLKEDMVVQLGYEPIRIDILNSIDGVDFDACHKRMNKDIVDGIATCFISLEDLIEISRQQVEEGI